MLTEGGAGKTNENFGLHAGARVGKPLHCALRSIDGTRQLIRPVVLSREDLIDFRGSPNALRFGVLEERRQSLRFSRAIANIPTRCTVVCRFQANSLAGRKVAEKIVQSVSLQRDDALLRRAEYLSHEFQADAGGGRARRS